MKRSGLLSEELANWAVDQLEIGIIVFDQEPRVYFFNPASLRLLGPGSDIKTNSSLPEVFREPQLINAFLEKKNAEIEIIRQGRLLKLQIQFQMINEELMGLITIDDIARESALEQVRKKFISNISHELKTPVTAIKLSLESMESSGELPSSLDGTFQVLKRSLGRMEHLLDDIVELSLIESGALKLKNTDLNLKNFLDDLSMDFASIKSPNGHSLKINMAPIRAEIIVDPIRLRQIIDNLISNACKYSIPDTQITLSSYISEDLLVISVADEGPGIPLLEQDKIFMRFYRTNLGRKEPGTGLGLSIVKNLAQLMGGDIAVKSALGEGSVFTLSIPINPLTV